MPIGWFALALPREGSDFVVKISIQSPRGVPIGWFALALPREDSDFVVKISMTITPGECQSGGLL